MEIVFPFNEGNGDPFLCGYDLFSYVWTRENDALISLLLFTVNLQQSSC